ncbi:MAG: cytochrome c biogenesis protein ResB [Candidatus Velthaea sp.]
MSVTTAKSNPLAELYAEFISLFANVLFAVSLFGVWGVLTLIGVIVDQGKDPSFYWQNYAPPLARLVLRLDLVNIYHSAAYVGIIGLILLSLGVCTFKRVIPARLPPWRAVKIDKIPLNTSVPVRGEEEAVRARISAFFAQRGWQIRKREIAGDEWTFADKHNWARRGVLVAHIGFVIIAAGTSIYWAKGFSGTTAVISGESVTIPETRAKIVLDRFAYRIDPIATKSGTVYQPIDYVSNVTYTGNDGIARKGQLRVNHPLGIDGTDYYQSTYGFAIDFVVTRNGRLLPTSPTHPLKEGEAFPIAGSNRAIQYTRFIGTIDRRTGQAAADPRPNDPAVVIQAYDGDRPIGQALIPLGGNIDLGNGYRLAAKRYTLYSGFQYRYDPGIPLVGIGAFVLLAGLCISFYLLPARVYVQITGERRNWNVGIAATTVKGFEIYQEEFSDLVEALKRSEEGPKSQVTTSPVFGAV